MEAIKANILNITNELLSQVIDRKAEFLYFIEDDYQIEYIFFIKNNTYWNRINIYEFAFKCKEWALSKGYRLLSLNKECYLCDTEGLCDISEQLNQWSELFKANTEIEAIIKACEWILEKKDKKC